MSQDFRALSTQQPCADAGMKKCLLSLRPSAATGLQSRTSARPSATEVRDIRVSDTVTGMMIAAVSGAVVGFLTAGGVACAALVFVAAIVGAYAGWQARGDD
jgi:uncharacterized protein YcfJ